ncbi:XTP/dITP diphosphohydrolase [Propionibacteriaceae bacterium ES.041]|uniref:MazG family protein n=1 Tax=Enemella evansiae TaxID=2016499 RepID=UPI000B974BA2|nr:MazG family protein [Enemella evansiae]OYO03093.1 nucleoside triphosphate pyrophosphohydrolase [Enemella evansiae]PFG68272.1 XTP/dITP diphosphohydrolase [Propionibacteriaceae bacterium ES.041]TDO86392.1 XTP/dITP diphosphohydrolase [Enemella evansiae]
MSTGETTPSELDRLVAVMARLRVDCPWDARQTHRSLVHYLIEETGEVVDAIEAGDDTDLREELGDLLLQVVFHAAIAAEQQRFDIDDVARGIGDKLVGRHPWVFADTGVPDDLNATWEAGKKAEKGRTSSLDGIPTALSALARADKVMSRSASHGVPLDLPEEPITADEVGAQALALVSRARASGIDAEQAVRDALRGLEDEVRRSETDSAS